MLHLELMLACGNLGAMHQDHRLKVYLIPAPDMDERALRSISLDGIDVVRIVLPRLTLQTTPKDVASFIARQIGDASPILVGFCYGGVLAVEVGKQIRVKRVVIVSGIKDRREIGPIRTFLARGFCMLPYVSIRMLGAMISGLKVLMLPGSTKIPRVWLKVEQNKFILKHSLILDPQGFHGEIVQVHGSKDRVVPLCKIGVKYVIEGAGHFMLNHHRKDVLAAISQAITL